MRRQSREGWGILEEKQRLLPCYCTPKKDTKDGQLSSNSQEDTKDTKGWGRLGRASASTSQSQFLPSKLRADPSLWRWAVTHSMPWVTANLWIYYRCPQLAPCLAHWHQGKLLWDLTTFSAFSGSFEGLRPLLPHYHHRHCAHSPITKAGPG